MSKSNGGGVMEKAFTKKGLSDWTWAVSGLTHVIGEAFVCSSVEGHSVSWADDDGYWLWLDMSEEDGTITARIEDNSGHNDRTLYAALGYCQYHNIPHVGVGDKP